MMTAPRIVRSLTAAVLLALSVSCGRPDTVEQFIKADAAGPDGEYLYQVDMTDSLCTYDFWFYTRVDAVCRANIRLRATWTAPGGDTLVETVYLNPGGAQGSRELYRSGIVPAEHGLWTLSVTTGDLPKGFRGLGLIYTRND